MVEKCPICGHGIMIANQCPKYEASIHQNHCEDCPYFVEMFFHCRFHEDALEKARILTVKEKKRERLTRIRRTFLATIKGTKKAAAQNTATQEKEKSA